MRLSRRLGGLLAAGLMAAGVTAAAVPARASTLAPYWQIVTLAGTPGAPFLCLQGDLGGPLGTTVTQQLCSDVRFPTSPSQEWLPLSLGGDSYKFQNVGTGLCLEARDGAVNLGHVALWDCTSTESNTRWQWPTVSGQAAFPATHPIQSRVSGSFGFCLDVPGGASSLALSLQTYRCNGTVAQLFWVTR
jgi:hypothetical protein